MIMAEYEIREFIKETRRLMMALTREYKETIMERASSDDHMLYLQEEGTVREKNRQKENRV